SPQGSHLARLFAIDRRSALLIQEQLAAGDVDRNVWRHVLGWETEFHPQHIDHLLSAVQVSLLHGGDGCQDPGTSLPGDIDPETRDLANAINLSHPRPDAAVTNVLALARYK